MAKGPPKGSPPPRPITRLLIANRAEIVARVARTAHRLGIATFGVYSEPDAGALHTRVVGQAVAIGGATAAESYLDVAKLLAAAERIGADAVHPGYGFLAENAAFARAVLEAGLIWVGPEPEQLSLMGDKLRAKAAAAAAGVPILDAADDRFPVLVKAAAGGGGRGMRLVASAADLDEALASAGREAQAAFGDPTVFVERYIERGRHVEVQVFGDHHGTVIHLHERECSVQRRNQKLIEESPAPGITTDQRAELCEAAARLARSVGYVGAGTVEFIVDGSPGEPGSSPFYFLEMNTRLQVEHPVTEAVTGLDLVELQLRVAEGQPLGLGQADVQANGHAIEVRVVAEDPAAGWRPGAGRWDRFPDAVEGIRWEPGYATGTTVPAEYDSLVAKAIAKGADRSQAARLLAAALAGAPLYGPPTNREWLVGALRSPAFLSGDTTTAFVVEHPKLADPPVPPPHHLAAVVLARHDETRAADRHWGFAPSGWRNLPTQGQRSSWRGSSGAGEVAVEYRIGPDSSFRLRQGAQEHTGRRLAGGLELDGVHRAVVVERHGDRYWVSDGEAQSWWEAVARFVDHDAVLVGGGPVAPLPGTIVSVAVAAGDQVLAGQVLMVLEAMKMEHRITAPADAVVTAVRVAVGDKVEVGQVLVELELQ